jgi:hypothetical protein
MGVARGSFWVPDILHVPNEGWLTHGETRRHLFLLTITFY